MPSYEDYTYNVYSYTPDYDSITPNYSYESLGISTIDAVIRYIHIFISFPLILILNLVLFVKIVGTSKIKGEPWRWFIAHGAFTTIVSTLLQFNEQITYMFMAPSIFTTVACPAARVLQICLFQMTAVSAVLVAIERFHALRNGKENEGGFDKKAVILCLVLFWVLVLGVKLSSIATTIFGYGSRYYNSYPYAGLLICYSTFVIMDRITNLIIGSWALVTFLVVITGMLVLNNRKTTTQSMVKSIVAPTVAFAVVNLIFMVVPYLLLEIVSNITHLARIVTTALSCIDEIVVAIIWLAAWSHVGDISMKCGKPQNDEERRLLNEM